MTKRERTFSKGSTQDKDTGKTEQEKTAQQQLLLLLLQTCTLFLVFSLGVARPPGQGSLNILELDQLLETLLVSISIKHRPCYHPQGFHGHDLIVTDLSVDRRFTEIAGCQRARSLSESSVPKSEKCSPKSPLNHGR
jgi:hypothetical protein